MIINDIDIWILSTNTSKDDQKMRFLICPFFLGYLIHHGKNLEDIRILHVFKDFLLENIDLS